jgi:hypothetical protein
VGRYTQNPNALPPVVVFDTEDGLLLADGYDRVASAQRRGAETIDAEVRHGSREDALRYAAELGAAQHRRRVARRIDRPRGRGRRPAAAARQTTDMKVLLSRYRRGIIVMAI